MRLSKAFDIFFIGLVGALSNRIAIPADIATKTFEYYLRTISGLVRDLYRGDITEGEFVDTMAGLIEAQLTRAWNEGMRINELDPEGDMTEEWKAILEGLILSEYNYVDGFAADIVAARDQQLPWEPLLARAQMWANRYNDVVNQSVRITKEQKLIWIFGDTEHCSTCERLNGIVAFSSEWEKAGVHPQTPPNNKLACGGWRCACSLIPTGNRRTRNALNAIQSAL